MGAPVSSPAAGSALVLSAGGSFGAYQAGAWRALEESGWRPGSIVGASIGAVNGFVLSRGGGAAGLERIWRDSAGGKEALPAGASLRRFRGWLREIHEEFAARPQAIPLEVVVTGLPSLSLRALRGESLTFDELRASCAVPLLFAPVRAEGRWYVDGGFLEPLPLAPALQRGAREIVAVDLLAHPPSRLLRRARRIAAAARDQFHREPLRVSDERLRGARVIRIEHPEALGNLRECFSWNQARIERWIEAGYEDTRRALQEAPLAPGCCL